MHCDESHTIVPWRKLDHTLRASRSGTTQRTPDEVRAKEKMR
jgi:hypothetical protein